MQRAQAQGLPVLAKFYVAAVVAAGGAAIYLTLRDWTPHWPLPFFLFLLITIVSSGMKVRFPSFDGTMSVNYVFTLLALLELDRAQALLLALVATLIQTTWHAKKRPQPVQFVFNLACLGITVAAAAAVFEQPWFNQYREGEAIRLAIAGITYFCVNTVCVSTVIGLSERRSIPDIWRSWYFWTFPFYLVGVSLAEMVHTSILRLGWRFSIAVIPLLYALYRSFRLYLEKLQQEQTHNVEMTNVHLRTIEALAMAIEAKDECTRDHLRRVQVYSENIAGHMKLPEAEIQALRTAAILHDIGKLAVPDYIISKPGKLTPEEFDKMKIHTVVGAAILERVGFPYAVSPIVRSHHEKWDGSGYPDGMKGEDIPIGARILSAVDCLDALSSDRQYRPAMPLDEAMEYVASLAGRSFDPAVVDVLNLHYREFENLAMGAPIRTSMLDRDVAVKCGDAPDAGFQNDQQTDVQEVFLASIVAARQEVQAILELTQELSGALRLDEMLSVVAERLKKLVPFDGMALYIREGGALKITYAHGEDGFALTSGELPLGQGLSGWVVENNKPILNGNPAVESGNPQDAGKLAAFKSALSIPLDAENLAGALTLYDARPDAYNKEHLRLLLAISHKIAQAIGGSLRFQQAQHEASTDDLTGLPNARSLCVYIQDELVHAKLTRARGAILVCDLDGFKSVNDNFGHLVGNRLLQAVARILHGHCRASDYVGRLGGDEFVMLWSGVLPRDLDGRIAEIERMVRKASLELCGSECVGISIGCAFFPEHGLEAEALLSRADDNMYRAKQERKASRHNVIPLRRTASHVA